MKKVFNNKLFIFILGGLLCSSITYAATLLASNITYDNTNSGINANNVQDAIDALYNKAGNTSSYDEYSGSTTYTPNNTTQTIPTNNKVLKSDITIYPIPSSYKNLNQTTTVTSENLPNGVTAYNNNGQFITGSLQSNCSTKTVKLSSTANTQTELFSYVPTSFSIYGVTTNNVKVIFYYDSALNSNKYYVLRLDSSNTLKTFGSDTNMQIINNKVYYNNEQAWLNVTLTCTVCN